MASCNLIVNADDLGISEAVSDGIFEGHANGIITAASLMVNGSAFEYAVEQLQCFPDLDIGLHLTLVEESPVSEVGRVKSLVDSGGSFFRHAKHFLGRYMLGKIIFSEVYEELDAQICRAKEEGVSITHLDMHQHLHCLPKIRGIVVDLAKAHKIQCMRYPREALQPYMFTNISRISRVAELCVLNTLSKTPKIDGMHSPDEMLGFFYGGSLDKQNLLVLLGCLERGKTYELMCHPGKSDKDSKYMHWAYNWQKELDAVKDVEVKNYLAKQNVNLVNYRFLS